MSHVEVRVQLMNRWLDGNSTCQRRDQVRRNLLYQYIREQSISQENEKSNDEHHSMPIEKVGNLLACVVAKAIADNSIDSYLIATLILFNFYKKSKTCMLPVGNILASLFEGNSTAVPNPFQGSLLSTKDEGAKSVSCRSEGTVDESMAGRE